MNQLKNRPLFIALLIPFLALSALTGFKAFKRFAGQEIIIPISGYDPRDILSGHFLTYRLDLVGSVCSNDENYVDRDDKAYGSKTVLLCLELSEKRVTTSTRIRYEQNKENCGQLLKGHCQGSRFLADVERFYIPEEYSQQLDSALRKWGDKQHITEILLSVDPSGQAVVKDLLIDKKSWKDYFKSL
jgi:uncharacterized membrane-anchored protein